ncbi:MULTISPECIES: hypothetical protein [Emticicia]|uniref:hypothetical protein n=1 Tax=Emticicia TaxID=312278 RepID=UPI0007D897F0|nr:MULTISPECIES: hypothetical protein [Emticicia]
MTNKLNLSAVERYSKAYAAKICDDFFAQYSSITGKQILGLTAIQQVNMLTIKALFDKWQGETQRLRSPYFDFGASEVQQALKTFMNTVSQHISIKREHFEPLLIDSVGEALVLILDPQTFYKELMRDLPSFKFSHENIRPLTKYILINKDVLPKLAEKLNGQEFVFANQAMTWLEETPLSLENPDEYLAKFDEIVPIPEDLVPRKAAKIPEMDTNTSFFDFVTPTTPPQVVSQQPRYEPQPVVERIYTPKPAPAVVERERFVEPAPVIQERAITPEPRPVPVQRPEPTPLYEQRVESLAPRINEARNVRESEDVRLNEKLAGEKKSLNDQTQLNKTVLDYHQNSRIEGITGVISLNQRFLFTNNLFGGNIQAFSHALEELELCKDFSEAKELILKKYVPRYMWDITGAEAEEFIDIVKRKFN